MSESSPSSYLMFVGSYTNFDVLAHLPKAPVPGKGINVYHFLNGSLTLLKTIPCLNPAVMCFHPKYPNILYALSECVNESGIIHQFNFTVDKNSRNDLVLNVNRNQSFTAAGKSTCYLGLDPKTHEHAIGINYWEGSVDVFKMCQDSGKSLGLKTHIEQNDYSLLGRRRQVVDRMDHWKNRQVGAHAHSVHFHGNYVFIPDLGENAIYQYQWDCNSGKLTYDCQLKLHEGAGPRHMVFHPSLNVCYVSNELDSSVSIFAIDTSASNREQCKLSTIQTLNTLPTDYVNDVNNIEVKNYVAEILVSPDGRFLYVSNRGHNSITIFTIHPTRGTVKYVACSDTYGKTPRHFNITPDGHWLVSANQDSNNLIVFKRNLGNGRLTKMDQISNEHTCAPNYVLFHPVPVRVATRSKL